MKRRDFLKIGAWGAGAAALAGCNPATAVPTTATTAGSSDADGPVVEWQMATSWPVALDVIFGTAQGFADRVAALTGGKFKITPRAAGELAPATQVLDVVSQGAVQCGHTAAYYYIGKTPAVAFGTTLPFGLTASQQNAWLYDGGGLQLLQDLYKTKFNLIQFPAGNTGAQMGGWFRREINTVEDMVGLKMRIPGLGGQVMTKLGVLVQALPGGEIYQALETSAIDAAEWVGPYDDEILGLNKVAEYYYSPGWWEPGPSLEVQINLTEWEKLPAPYQAAVQAAAYEANVTMLGRYDARNNEALERLVAGGVQLRSYSDEIMEAAEKAAFELYDESAASDADFAAIYTQWKEFRARVYKWHSTNEANFTRYMYARLEE